MTDTIEVVTRDVRLANQLLEDRVTVILGHPWALQDHAFNYDMFGYICTVHLVHLHPVQVPS